MTRGACAMVVYLCVATAACASSKPSTPTDAATLDSAHSDARADVGLDAGGQDAASLADAQMSDATTRDATVPDAGEPLRTARGVMAARTAQDFVDSVGVNTHLGYTDRNYWDFDRLADTIADLGVRHIRDGQPRAPDHQNAQSTAGIVSARLQALSASGVKATLISGYALEPSQATAFAREQLAVFKHLGVAVAAFEHTNEPDLFAARTDNDWEAHLRAYLPALWQERNADSATAQLPVLAPSVTFEFQAFATSFPTQRDHVTHCNVHPYPGGEPPESNVLRALGACDAFVGDIPAVATETGYHTAIHDTSGHNGVSEAAQGIYLPRLFLEYFRQGFARTHSYELLDEYADPLNNQREAQFGLVRLDWSPKPAFVALQRLLAMLTDTDAYLTPSGIVLGLSDRNVRVVLLQKGDGSFWIALWRPRPVFDLTTKSDVPVMATPVTLTFESAPREVRKHALRDVDPNADITPGSDELTVDVGAEVVLLEVRGVPARLPLPSLTDRFDDLSFSTTTNVVIENNPVRAHDFDDGLARATTNGATISYAVDGLHDFQVRGYFFCQGCINHPLDAIAFQRSDDGTTFVDIPHDVVDRRPTMDAREVVTLVPRAPLPATTQHLRIVLGTSAPSLSEARLLR